MTRMFMHTIAIVLFAATAFAQNGFDTVIPDGPINLTVDDNTVYVFGHWTALDKHSELLGPSVSTIFCQRSQNVCNEENASMNVMEGMFSLTPEHLEYTVERWTPKEIVAASVSGICLVRNVLKFDLVEKRVYYSQTLSEPVDSKMPKMSKDICSAVGMNLELKANSMWKK